MGSYNIKYLSIYEELKQRIIDNKYIIGELFPAEPELQQEFNASRITIRRSVQMLVDDGYLQKMPGVGTIVISNKGSLQLNTLVSFSKDNQNKNNKSEIVSYKLRYAPKSVVLYYLKLSQNDVVAYQERIRYIDDEPIGFQKIYVPSFVGLDEQSLNNPTQSIYQLFEEKGHKVSKARELIEAVTADEILANYIQIEKGTPLLYVQRITEDISGKVVEYAEIYYRGDRYHYTIDLKAL